MVVMPVWFALYLMYGPKPRAPPTGSDATEKEKVHAYDHSNELQAVLPAVLVGYLVPAMLLDNPLLGLSQRQSDLANFAWQLFPVSVALLLPAFEAVLPTTLASAHAVEQTALLWTSAICRLIHFGSILEVVQHSHVTHATLSELWTQVSRPVRNVPLLTQQIYGFLLADISLTILATGVFVLLLPGRSRTPKWRLGLMMLAGSLMQGPAASLAWGYRTRRREMVGPHRR